MLRRVGFNASAETIVYSYMNFWIRPILLLTLLAVLPGLPQPSESSDVIPNDPLFRLQYSLHNPHGEKVKIPASRVGRPDIELSATPGFDLNVTRAWKLTTGSGKVIVAVLDDGFFYQHEDIRDNLWRNAGETGTDARGRSKATNGVDDDGNGYADDVVGWDFAFDDPDPDAYIFDGMDRDRIQPAWHSISALGIIGAKGNNGIGVAGINWNVSLMLLKIGAQGIRRGELDRERPHRAARAIRYAVDNGARIINWSGFVDQRNLAELSELRAAFDYAEQRRILIVLGAGNSADDLDVPEKAFYPQMFPNKNIMRVAEVDLTGKLAPHSNFGKRAVHIAAIGRNYTTFVFNGLSTYEPVVGTSNSGPVVSGVAALMLSIRPDMAADQMKQILTDSARRLPELGEKVACGGAIDAYAAVAAALRYPNAAIR